MKKPIVLICLLTFVLTVSCNLILPFGLTINILIQKLIANSESNINEPIVCEDDSCLNQCLSRIEQVMGYKEFSSLPTYDGMDANFDLVVYPVTDGEKGEPTLLFIPSDFREYQEDFESQDRIWNYIERIIPANAMKKISRFTIYTDGPGNSLAHVDFSNSDRAHWNLGFDIVDSGDPIQLSATIAHEFGHLLTLNDDQISYEYSDMGWSQHSTECPAFAHVYGCAYPDSYINLFYQKFWKGIFDEWMNTVINSEINQGEDVDSLVEDFYSVHSEEFFSEFAATNINEDMAVSFTYFVLTPKPQGNSIVEQKILFFYDFPELVDFRQQMIQAICTYEN